MTTEERGVPREDVGIRSLFEETSDAIAVLVVDDDLAITESNDAFRAVVGSDDPTGTALTDWLDPAGIDPEGLCRDARGGETVETTARVPGGDAASVHRLRVVPCRVGEDATTAYALLTDTTQTEQLEREMAELHDRISDAFFSLDEEFRFVRVSETAERLIDRTEDELRGEVVWDQFPGAVGTTFEREYRRAMRAQESVSFEEYFAPLDTWFRVRAYPSETGLSVYFRDVTDQKEREAELERSEARYRSLTEDVLDTADVAFVVVDDDGTVAWANAAFAEYFGLDPADVAGTEKRRLIEESVTPALRDPARFREHALAAGDGPTERLECRVRDAPGRPERWLEYWSQPIESGLYEGGRIDHYADVTEQKRTERALERERDRLSALYENTSNAIAVLDLSAGSPAAIERVNAAFVEQFPYERDELVGTPTSVVDRLPAEPFAPETLGAVADGETVETSVTHERGGERREFIVRVVPVADGEERRACAIFTDVTDRERLSRERAERTRLTEVLAAASRMGRAETEADLYERTVDALEDVFDCDAVAVVVEDAVVAATDDRGVDRTAVETVRVTGEPVVERDVTVGDAVYDRVVTAPAGEDGALQLLYETTTATARVRDGTVEELLGTHLAETRRRIERERRAAAERERLEFLHRALRHNLLNGMNLVRARAELIEEGVDGAAADHVETIHSRTEDMIDRLETMRSFVRTVVEDDHELESVELRATVERELETAREVYPEAEFVLDGEVPAVSVRADDLLSEVFENVLSNAVQHNDAAVPEVHVSTAIDDEQVHVRISDNGPGIPQDRREAVFAKGTAGEGEPSGGFGLYLVEELLAAYGGDVAVGDAELGGAEFVVTLPRA